MLCAIGVYTFTPVSVSSPFGSTADTGCDSDVADFKPSVLKVFIRGGCMDCCETVGSWSWTDIADSSIGGKEIHQQIVAPPSEDGRDQCTSPH